MESLGAECSCSPNEGFLTQPDAMFCSQDAGVGRIRLTVPRLRRFAEIGGRAALAGCKHLNLSKPADEQENYRSKQ